MNTTGTQTHTYTVVDIRKVVDCFAADYAMIAQATGLRTPEAVAETVSDLRSFAENGYLVDITVFLLDGNGNKVRGVIYQVSSNAIGWRSDRPGGNLWPRVEGGRLWIIATLSNDWWNMSDDERISQIAVLGLNSSWAKTTVDTSFAGLAASRAQQYSSNGFGMERTNYTK